MGENGSMGEVGHTPLLLYFFANPRKITFNQILGKWFLCLIKIYRLSIKSTKLTIVIH
jgi:hypothetical protein